MLVGAYPFEDPNEPKDFRKTIQVYIRSLDMCPFSDCLSATYDFCLLLCREFLVSNMPFLTVFKYLKSVATLSQGFLFLTQRR